MRQFRVSIALCETELYLAKDRVLEQQQFEDQAVRYPCVPAYLRYLGAIVVNAVLGEYWPKKLKLKIGKQQLSRDGDDTTSA